MDRGGIILRSVGGTCAVAPPANKVTANMPAGNARFMVDRNRDPEAHSRPIETNQELSPQFHLRRGKLCLLRERDSVLRGPAISSVNLSTNKCYGALINRSRIPCLDGREVGLTRLISCTGTPAMSLKEICC